MPAADPLVRPRERDPRPLRRPLAQVGEEEGETGAKALARPGSHSLDDFVRELVAQEAAAVERLPDRRPDGLHFIGAERRVHDALRIGPGGQAFAGRAEHGPPCRVPERQLAGGVEVKRSADRPGLDERSLLPQRRPNVGLRYAVDPRGELQLGGCLHLRVHATYGACDLDQTVAARTLA